MTIPVTHKATQYLDIAVCGKRKYLPGLGFHRTRYPFEAAWFWRQVTCKACLKRRGLHG
jgi:hypothetical protein